jgi:hypothetical protein
MRNRFISPALALSFALGCASDLEPITTCEPRGDARPVCGFQNPEDLALLPDAQTLVVSEYGSMGGDRAGQLALLELGPERRSVVFRGGDARGTEESWGDPACPGPPGREFSPHGIHLRTRSDGRLQLLAVQHGGRESVEFFELTQALPVWRATWRGCAVAPETAWLNDVVALPSGGFLVTHMMPRADLATLRSSHERPPVASGHVFEWQRGRGFSVVAGTQSPLPNGIELSRDGALIYLNVSGTDEVWRIERATGRVTGRADVPGPDNSSWAADGKLLVASRTAPREQLGVCADLAQGACPLPFQIVAVDPHSMETQVLYRGGGAPMGGGTVGLRVGRELFIGSFAGDRILRVRLD